MAHMESEAAEPTDRVEKTMTLSRAEFDKSLAAFLGRPTNPVATTFDIPAGEGRVLLTYEPLPAVRLGGLLELPRARIALELSGLTPTQRQQFLERFDIAFQRGGG